MRGKENSDCSYEVHYCSLATTVLREMYEASNVPIPSSSLSTRGNLSTSFPDVPQDASSAMTRGVFLASRYLSQRPGVESKKSLSSQLMPLQHARQVKVTTDQIRMNQV